MTVSLADLLTIPTKDQVIDKFAGLLRLAGFPVASWQTTSFMRHTVETESDLHVDLATLIQKVAKGGFIKLAVEVGDSWVDLCADNVFAEVRKGAVFTQGRAEIADTAGIGPVTINPGTFYIANANKTLRYFNVTGGSIPLNGSLPLTFQAETAGGEWNVGPGELVEILTPQPGLKVSNPAQETGTWISQQGTDVETSERLAQRCLDKWSMIGSGSDDGAYRYRATSSSAEITDALVFSPGGGAVRVVLRGDSGPVSLAALAAATSIILQKRPIGVPDVLVLNANPFVQPLAGTVFVTPGRDPAATLAAVQASVNAFQRKLPLGAKVSREKVIRALLVDNVDDLDLTTPLLDVQIGQTDVWLPSYALVTG